MISKASKLKLFRPLLLFFLFGLVLIIVGALVLRGVLPVGSQTGLLSQKSPSLEGNPIKLVIVEDGIYKVDLIKLKALGLAVSTTGLANLEMTNIGKAQLFWVNHKAGELYFFGRGINSRYSRENIYMLGQKRRISGENQISQPGDGTSEMMNSNKPPDVSPGKLPGESYAALTHLEENLVYNPLVVDGDHWLWETLLAPGKKTIDIDLKASLPGPAQVRLMLWGSTEASISPDHHLIIRVNGQQAADERWDGKGRRLIEANLPPSLLQEGRNQVEIELPGDTGAAAEILFVDWVEIIYPRQYQAIDDHLSFVSPGGKIKLQGFTGPVDIYDFSDPGLVVHVDQAIDPKNGFASEAGHSYWVVGPAGKIDPLRMEMAVVTPNLRSENNSADYLAVGPPELLDPLNPLLDWREQQGLKTMAVPIQAVYDQFNFGLTDPQAVRNLLEYAQKNWASAPKYLTLVGDASFDPKGYQAQAEANRLPTFFIQTQRGGETASDFGFAVPGNMPWPADDENQTGLAQIAVGRLPARIPSQVTEYVNKVISYEKSANQFNPASPWQKQILAIADGSDSSFRTDAKNLLQMAPDKYETELLAPQSGDQEYGQVIRERLDKGSWFVVYFGHGSINMWGKDKIFTKEDVAKLRNYERLPIMLHLTCLTGLFTHPHEESLSEALIWEPNGGAIAVLAPTSLTLQEDQSYLSYAIEKELVGDVNARMGDVLLRARQNITADYTGAQEVLRTFLLFGDPALKIARFPNQ